MNCQEIREAIKVGILYLKVADIFYEECERKGVKFTKGRLKFRADVGKSIESLLNLAKEYISIEGFPKKLKYPTVSMKEYKENNPKVALHDIVWGYNKGIKDSKLATINCIGTGCEDSKYKGGKK